MSDLAGLRKRLSQRSFAGWDDFVSSALVTQSEEAVRHLIDRLIALGTDPTRAQVQAEITACVIRFNALDRSQKDSWICTIEREDIGEVLWTLADLCGFDGSEEWLTGRDW